MLDVVEVESTPAFVLRALNAGPGRTGPEEVEVPVLLGRVAGLPRALGALVLGSDLQSIVVQSDGTRLTGEAAADLLADLGDAGVLPPPGRTGVVLAGDLWSEPDCGRRGGRGDVRPVWRAFARRFRWVAGVAGNHDAFGAPHEVARFAREPGVHLLDPAAAGGTDGDHVVDLDGLRLAGVGGIAGDPTRPARRWPEDMATRLAQAHAARPDLVVAHEGPDDPARGWRGAAHVREALAGAPGRAPLVFGHRRWPQVLSSAPCGRPLINTDGRLLVLERA